MPEPIIVSSRSSESATYNQIAIECGTQRIVISDPHKLDDLIMDLLKARRITWPWPNLVLDEIAFVNGASHKESERGK